VTCSELCAAGGSRNVGGAFLEGRLLQVLTARAAVCCGDSSLPVKDRAALHGAQGSAVRQVVLLCWALQLSDKVLVYRAAGRK
jgi:hypothetical protein